MMRYILVTLGLILSLSMNSTPLKAQELSFDFNDFKSCAGSGVRPQDCIGVAANVCIRDTPGGESTIGMGACLSAELQAWDDLLNATYSSLRPILAQSDAENTASGFQAPSQADAVQQMQRDWIPFRDTKCAFIRSLWGGGTGGSPAEIQCLMQETAKQTLYLGDILASF